MHKKHIHISRRSLYQSKAMHLRIPRHVIAMTMMIAIVAPAWAAMEGLSLQPREQDFIITAYYSPMPDQCCYVKGSEEADKILNGEGRAGADGTPVYPGMAAAPGSYAFGTRIVLPGIGVVTVHDRGGAIQEWEKAHRLDLWVGYGEEGLARALAFGVQRVHGTVYASGAQGPEERFVAEHFVSPWDRLKPFLTLDNGLLDARPRSGEKGLSVTMLQEHLRDLGYFHDAVSGLFGDETKNALTQFLRDMGADDPSDQLTAHAAALLVAAVRQKQHKFPVGFIDAASAPVQITAAQRLLRFLGLYKGRTDGQYSDTLKQAILAFQKQESLIGGPDSPGAGRIGPVTRAHLSDRWQRTMVGRKANALLTLTRVTQMLEKKGRLVTHFMELGYSGPDVRAYQQMLSDRGFFPKEKINGVFGDLTRSATIRYQLAMKLITKETDAGAGTVGAKTMRLLRQEEVRRAQQLVRSYGWQVL